MPMGCRIRPRTCLPAADHFGASGRTLGYALRTEHSYLGWVERYIRLFETPPGFPLC